MAKKNPFDGIFDGFDGIFGDLFSTPLVEKPRVDLPTEQVTSANGVRSYSSTNDAKGMTLLVDLPGIDPKFLKLSVSDSKVYVSGKNGTKTFTCTYTIAPDYTMSGVSASWQHGQLAVRLLRKAEAELVSILIEIK